MFEGTAPAPEEVQPQPQPKKVKKEVVKVRDVINTAVNKLEVNKTQKYGNMVKSTLNEQTGGGGQGGPAIRPPSQDQAKGRPLQREGVIADIKVLYQQTAQTNNYQSFKCLQQNNDNNLMADNNMYIFGLVPSSCFHY